MKTDNKTTSVFLAAFIFITAISCQKENSLDMDAAFLPNQADIANAQAVAVAPAGSTAGDSLYIINTCQPDQRKEVIALSGLPASIDSYLTEDYPGYTFHKAFAVKDSNGNIAGYVVVILFNGKPVGLKFNASGAFTKVLEQREGRNIKGHGYHHGGHFDDRDGKKRDTVALASLSAVRSYFSTNYPGDTLIRAYRNRDNSIVVVSVNNGVFATVFKVDGSFIKRVQLPAKQGRAHAIELSALPTTAQSYLSTTYPNYVFKNAFTIMHGGSIQGYVVFIDANATKYGVKFDASGNFIKAVTVR